MSTATTTAVATSKADQILSNESDFQASPWRALGFTGEEQVKTLGADAVERAAKAALEPLDGRAARESRDFALAGKIAIATAIINEAAEACRTLLSQGTDSASPLPAVDRSPLGLVRVAVEAKAADTLAELLNQHGAGLAKDPHAIQTLRSSITLLVSEGKIPGALSCSQLSGDLKAQWQKDYSTYLKTRSSEIDATHSDAIRDLCSTENGKVAVRDAYTKAGFDVKKIDALVQLAKASGSETQLAEAFSINISQHKEYYGYIQSVAPHTEIFNTLRGRNSFSNVVIALISAGSINEANTLMDSNRKLTEHMGRWINSALAGVKDLDHLAKLVASLSEENALRHLPEGKMVESPSTAGKYLVEEQIKKNRWSITPNLPAQILEDLSKLNKNPEMFLATSRAFALNEILLRPGESTSYTPEHFGGAATLNNEHCLNILKSLPFPESFVAANPAVLRPVHLAHKLRLDAQAQSAPLTSQRLEWITPHADVLRQSQEGVALLEKTIQACATTEPAKSQHLDTIKGLCGENRALFASALSGTVDRLLESSRSTTYDLLNRFKDDLISCEEGKALMKRTITTLVAKDYTDLATRIAGLKPEELLPAVNLGQVERVKGFATSAYRASEQNVRYVREQMATLKATPGGEDAICLWIKSCVKHEYNLSGNAIAAVQDLPAAKLAILNGINEKLGDLAARGHQHAGVEMVRAYGKEIVAQLGETQQLRDYVRTCAGDQNHLDDPALTLARGNTELQNEYSRGYAKKVQGASTDQLKCDKAFPRIALLKLTDEGKAALTQVATIAITKDLNPGYNLISELMKPEHAEFHPTLSTLAKIKLSAQTYPPRIKEHLEQLAALAK